MLLLFWCGRQFGCIPQDRKCSNNKYLSRWLTSSGCGHINHGTTQFFSTCSRFPHAKENAPAWQDPLPLTFSQKCDKTRNAHLVARPGEVTPCLGVAEEEAVCAPEVYHTGLLPHLVLCLLQMVGLGGSHVEDASNPRRLHGPEGKATPWR